MSGDTVDKHQASAGCWCCCQTTSNKDVKAELIKLLKISWPVVLYQIFVFLLALISILFSGHLGPTELAAAALGQSVIHIACKSVFYGFTTAFDTLFAQTYGSTNKKRVGVMLQRAILTSTLVLIICMGVLVNTHPLLLLLGQDPEVSRLAGIYTYIYLIAAPVDVLAYLLIKYLQCQNHLMPTVVTMFITVVVNVFFHFLLITFLDFGLRGAIGAQVCSHYILVVLLLVYIKYKNLHAETWGGWTLDCLQEWGMVLRLGIPGTLMLCMEWWCFEVGFYIAGALGTAEVGAHSILFYIAGTLWSVGGGVGIGGSIHIGNMLGANKPEKAKVSAMILFGCAGVLGVSFSLLTVAMRNIIGYIFTTDSETLEILSQVILLLAIFETQDQLNGINSGIVRGAGHQLFGATVNFICISCIGVPLSIVLIFVCGFNIDGLWIGLIVGFLLQNICFIIFILKINWKMEALKAMERAAALPEKEQYTKDDDQLEDKDHLEQLYPEPVTHTTSTENAETGPLSTETEDLELHLMENSAQAESQVIANGMDTSVSGVPKDVSILTANELPLTKIIIRRVFALVCCLLWLCGGIAFSVFNEITSYESADVIHANATLQGNYSQSVDQLVM